MKKMLSLLLSLLMILSMIPAAVAEVDTSAVYAGIEPLETPMKLNLGYLSGSHHGMVSFLIDRLGGYDKVGLDVEIQTFGNGPVMVEAMASNAWDAGTIGLGGTLTGVISQGMYIIGAAARDVDSLRVLARNDSDLVADGVTVPEKNVYGTKEHWMGKEVLIPNGTTLHYTLSTGLETLGLTDKDVSIIHMDVPNVNTALRAKKGEVGAMWGSFVYADDINEDFTVVINATDLGIDLPTVMCANPTSYNDPEKYKAIKKWMELYFATVDFIQASDENFEWTCEQFTEINEEQGVISTVEENRNVLAYSSHYTLEENYSYFNEKVEAGHLRIEDMHVKPLQFYINLGSYAPESQEALLGGYFLGNLINEIHDAK